MRAWLIDSYRYKDKVVLWMKTPEQDFKIIKDFSVEVFIEICKASREYLENKRIKFFVKEKRNYLGQSRSVYSVKISKLSSYESFVRSFERATNHRVMMYDADIQPEQMFLYKHDLRPCTAVEIHEDQIIPIMDETAIPLSRIDVQVVPSADIRVDRMAPLRYLVVDKKKFEGSEKKILEMFSKYFRSKDPDVILMDYAFSRLPYLESRLKIYDIKCDFHRWDCLPIRYKGGKCFHSYGNITYRDFAIRLHGRFLVDTSTMVGAECDPSGIAELCQLSGSRFQQISSRSFGAVFQSALVREVVKRGWLVPFKEKPVDKPLSLFEMLKADRIGLTLDPKVGFHKDVAEIDFCSMYPWLIYNRNISADTILSDNLPKDDVPGLPISVTLQKKGLVPHAIKPFLDCRMQYKSNPTKLNKERAAGLKWVLVTSYGYLRFREFKLGIATSHMAIGAYAREIILRAMRMAEERGFKVMHGIVDSLYIQKKGINDAEVKDFCRDLELECGIPVTFEGILKWVVFLPSVNEKKRPAPTHYFGVFRSGDIKARGIEVRQRSTPMIVRAFQQEILELMAKCDNRSEIMDLIPDICRIYRKTLRSIPRLSAGWMSASVRLSKTDYKYNIPQKQAVSKLRKKGIRPMPGQKVSYVFTSRGVVLSEDYVDDPDIAQYRKLLKRAMFIVLQVFGFTRKDIERLADGQLLLSHFRREYEILNKIENLR